MLRRLILTLASFLLTASLLSAADPTETHYTWDECRGSFTPYPAPSHSPAYPDSLTPVMINHVGRHGARFPSSAKNCNLLVSALGKAEAAGTITPLGRNMLRIVRDVMTRVNGRPRFSRNGRAAGNSLTHDGCLSRIVPRHSGQCHIVIFPEMHHEHGRVYPSARPHG